MAAIEEGRQCIITAGADSGKKCRITKIMDENFVSVMPDGAKKERKISIRHLEPLA